MKAYRAILLSAIFLAVLVGGCTSKKETESTNEVLTEVVVDQNEAIANQLEATAQEVKQVESEPEETAAQPIESVNSTEELVTAEAPKTPKTSVDSDSPAQEVNTQNSEESVQETPVEAKAEPLPAKPDHSIWHDLVLRNVSADGKVNYQGIKSQRSILKQYLEHLAANPVQSSWSRNQQLAYWINAYNAFTVELILQHYPLKSIMDLDKPWDRKFIKLGSLTYSLNQIEHEIVRPQFKDARIHFALVCAATSCPKLLNQAYTESQVQAQLDRQTRYFLNKSGKNQLSTNQVAISQLFNWYGDDFKTKGSIIDYLNQYATVKIDPQAKVSFTEYDWSLNE